MARTIPTSATVSPGQFITGALWNAQVKGTTDYLTGPPVCSVYATAVQSMPGSNAMTALIFDTTVLDSDGGHSNVTNPSRYTATVPGTYLVIGAVAWVSNTTGDRRIQIALNGAGVTGSAASFDPMNPVICAHQAQALVTMNGTTDYVEVMVAQASGTSLSTSTGGAFSPSMRVIWISR
ncbi:hypothetical protein [Streptomyces yunnanensis]|uniref:C1q domain-containing protein n=1 Tax=Streptomyces yunnanensis TaxID=156453 RepID=A0A9X8MTE0_9ACTN|nr:hypothetical protein [Streptomyces yunnanensis]SHL76017.1 hypothetical protein SAMN05216268_106101 [Streptomyces yunnanensis]